MAARISASVPRAIGRPARFGLDRCETRCELRRTHGRLQVDAEPEHNVLKGAAVRRRFGENACELAPVDDHIVRPFDLGGQPGDGSNGFGQRNSAGERQQRGRIATSKRTDGPQNHRHVESGAGWRKPRAAMPASPGGLMLGDNGRPLFGATLREARSHVVGRAGGGEPVNPLPDRTAPFADARKRNAHLVRHVAGIA